MSLLFSLPSEVLLSILEYIDDNRLLRSRSVSRQWKELVDDEKLWMRKFHRLRHRPRWRDWNGYTWKERYFYSCKWIRSRIVQRRAIDMKAKYIPWLQLCGGSLWLSRGSRIDRIPLADRFSQQRHSFNGIVGDDFCRFVAKPCSDDGALRLAVGTRGGLLYLFSHSEGRDRPARSRCFQAHSSDLHCVDLLPSESLAVTGSRDRTVKVWRLADDHQDIQCTIKLGDRAWCLKADDWRRGIVAVGSAACWNECPPLTIWDIQCGRNSGRYGAPCQRGAGLLDLSFVSANSVICGGYDSVLRLYDLRLPNECAWSCEEPYNSTIYCVGSDGDSSAFVGTSHYGLVWLMDTRWPKPVQCYYVGAGNRPVYSLAADTRRLYVSVDSEVWFLQCRGRND